MTLTSIPFIFLFFPLTLLLSRLAGRRGRLFVLLLLSLVFAWLAGGRAVSLLIGVTIFTYLTGRGLRLLHGKHTETLLFIASVVIDLGLLAFYKYGSLFFPAEESASTGTLVAAQAIIPLGLSFYIFQSISYLADIRRGEEPLKNPIHFGIYMTFFPKFLSGPLVRLKGFRRDLTGAFPCSSDIMEGFERFLAGLCKKVILADQLGALTAITGTYRHLGSTTVSCLWVTSVAYTLQLYFDFSGYTDIAIGLGRMLGFHLPENFRDPYCCRSLSDFWRRWHISLSSWFRDYVYIPLGGSRRSAGKTVFNLLIVWVLTGMWHGSTVCFLPWGLGHFLLLVLEKYLIRPDRFASRTGRFFYRLFTLFCINLLWIFFQADSPSHLLQIIKEMFGAGSLAFAGPQTVFLLRNTGIFLAIGLVLASPLVRRIREPHTETARRILAVIRFAAVLLAVSYVIRGAYNPFVYQIF